MKSSPKAWAPTKPIFLLALLLLGSNFLVTSFDASRLISFHPSRRDAFSQRHRSVSFVTPKASSTRRHAATSQSQSLPLPRNLERLVAGLETMTDEKIRYKQLLFLATRLAPMATAQKIPKNKVPGCLSTVFISASYDHTSSTVNFSGDSDGLLTKGLVSMLVEGLSGSTPQEIQEVKEDFITRSGIGKGLTPGRNNGFVNMLATMKRKAAEAESDAAAVLIDEIDHSGTGPMYNLIKRKLKLLQPTSISLVDDSLSHKGHVGADGFEGESHFNLSVSANCFEGLTSVKRHKLIYTVLGSEVMEGIHALTISAKTDKEA